MPATSALLDRCAEPVRVENEMLVLWQHPTERSIHVIGRLSRTDDGYNFRYAQGAADISGFRPLPSLRDLSLSYSFEELLPVFAQRVMSPSRPDYAGYLSDLGLSADDASPWEQIVQSGGERHADTLQFMRVPRVADGRVEATFLVNGIRHIPGRRLLNGRSVTASEQEAALAALQPGDRLRLLAEDDNEFDQHATLVADGSLTPVGWAPRVLARGLRELMANPDTTVTVVRVQGPEVNPHLRLVVRVEADCSPGFTFDPEGEWEPIS